MDKILLKPIRSDAIYHGRFAELAFELLATPVPVYQSLLKHLGKYGANLNNLKYDATVISEANINCYFLDFNAMIRVRLDRLEVNFFRLHEIGEEIAKNIILDSWTAVHETEPSIEVVEHAVSINCDTQIEGTSYNAVIQRYVSIPPALGEKTRAGVGFYPPAGLVKGERDGSVVLDRLIGQEQGAVLKINMTFDAKQVRFDSLAQRIDEYVTGQLDRLGLKLDRGHTG
ncbi:MAG: hypothetical protein ACE5JU_24310 [Candidatus Binatia bacterium]